LLSTFTLFFTENIGFDEINTGYIITVYTSVAALFLFFSGFITDKLGIRKSLILTMISQFISRIGLIICGFNPDIPGAGILSIIFLVLGAPGAAMIQTVFQTSNNFYSTEKSRAASFNIWYLLMNVGAMMSGLVIDLVRKAWEIDITYIFVFAAITCILSLIVCMTAIMQTDGVKNKTDDNTNKTDFIRDFIDVFTEKVFIRMFVLLLTLLGARSIILYSYLLLPLYWKRVIEIPSGENTFMGLLQAINPFCIIVLVILIIPISNRFNVFNMLVGGTLISCLSLLFLIIPWEVFNANMAQAYFLMSIVMLVVLSIGEAIWSPKLYEYIAVIAPKGKEGTYLGIAMLPWFLSKTIVGLLSGHMLIKWVPEGVHEGLQTGTLPFWQSPGAMWLVLFIWAISGPLIAFLFKDWFTKDAKRDKSAQTTSGDTVNLKPTAETS